jgi:hypothetical protein
MATCRQRLTWTIEFHHDTHTHPFHSPITGVAGGEFTVFRRGRASANVFYRIHDGNRLVGAQSGDFVDRAGVVRIALLTEPIDLQLTGWATGDDAAACGECGRHGSNIGAPLAAAGQQAQLQLPELVGWRGQNHVIQTPAVDTDYTAFYRTKGPR